MLLEVELGGGIAVASKQCQSVLTVNYLDTEVTSVGRWTSNSLVNLKEATQLVRAADG